MSQNVKREENDMNDVNIGVTFNLFNFEKIFYRLIDFLSAKCDDIIQKSKTKYESDDQMTASFESTPKYNVINGAKEMMQNLKSKFGDESFDKIKYIQHYYKTLTEDENMKLFYPEPDIALFKIKTSEGRPISILPSINIRAVTDDKNIVTAENMDEIWGCLYLLYIFASNMLILSATRVSSRLEKTKLILQPMRQKAFKLVKMDENDVKNPYIGIGNDVDILKNNHRVDLNKFCEKYNEKNPTAQIDANNIQSGMLQNILGMGGLNIQNMIEGFKDMDAAPFIEAVKNIKEENYDMIAGSISQLMGSSDKKDVYKDICKSVIENIKKESENGTEKKNIFDMVGSSFAKFAENGKSKLDELDFGNMMLNNNNIMSKIQEQLLSQPQSASAASASGTTTENQTANFNMDQFKNIFENIAKQQNHNHNQPNAQNQHKKNKK